MLFSKTLDLHGKSVWSDLRRGTKHAVMENKCLQNFTDAGARVFGLDSLVKNVGIGAVGSI